MMRNSGSLTHCTRFIRLLRRQWSAHREGQPVESPLMSTGPSQGPVSTIVKKCGPLHHAASHPCSGSAGRHPEHNGGGQNARAMSTNTKGSRPPAPPYGGGGRDKASPADQWREKFMEKQSDYKKAFVRVKEPPQPSNQQWWKPDPMTGVWVPEDYHGCVETAPKEAKPKATKHVRSETSLDREWFENMEELPDLDRKPL